MKTLYILQNMPWNNELLESYINIADDITHTKIDDIIVSGDNKLCRVTGFSEDGQALICNLIMSGGGGTGTGRILSIKAVTGKAFPDYCMNEDLYQRNILFFVSDSDVHNRNENYFHIHMQ